MTLADDAHVRRLFSAPVYPGLVVFSPCLAPCFGAVVEQSSGLPYVVGSHRHQECQRGAPPDTSERSSRSSSRSVLDHGPLPSTTSHSVVAHSRRNSYDPIHSIARWEKQALEVLEKNDPVVQLQRADAWLALELLENALDVRDEILPTTVAAAARRFVLFALSVVGQFGAVPFGGTAFPLLILKKSERALERGLGCRGDPRRRSGTEKNNSSTPVEDCRRPGRFFGAAKWSQEDAVLAAAIQLNLGTVYRAAGKPRIAAICFRRASAKRVLNDTTLNPPTSGTRPEHTAALDSSILAAMVGRIELAAALSTFSAEGSAADEMMLTHLMAGAKSMQDCLRQLEDGPRSGTCCNQTVRRRTSTSTGPPTSRRSGSAGPCWSADDDARTSSSADHERTVAWRLVLCYHNLIVLLVRRTRPWRAVLGEGLQLIRQHGFRGDGLRGEVVRKFLAVSELVSGGGGGARGAGPLGTHCPPLNVWGSKRFETAIKTVRERMLRSRGGSYVVTRADAAVRIQANFRGMLTRKLEIRELVAEATDHGAFPPAGGGAQDNKRRLSLRVVSAAQQGVRQYTASLRLQAAWRGFSARKRLQLSLAAAACEAASKIQSVFRGWFLRTFLKERHSAAACIQKNWRVFAVQKLSRAAKTPIHQLWRMSAQNEAALIIQSWWIGVRRGFPRRVLLGEHPSESSPDADRRIQRFLRRRKAAAAAPGDCAALLSESVAQVACCYEDASSSVGEVLSSAAGEPALPTVGRGGGGGVLASGLPSPQEALQRRGRKAGRGGAALLAPQIPTDLSEGASGGVL